MRLGEDCTTKVYICNTQKYILYITFNIFLFIPFSVPFRFPVQFLVKPRKSYFIRFWHDVSAWWETVAENVWNKYIKSWLCLLCNAFELWQAMGYRFNHVWTYNVTLRAKGLNIYPVNLATNGLEVHSVLAHLAQYYIDGFILTLTCIYWRLYWQKFRGLRPDSLR